MSNEEAAAAVLEQQRPGWRNAKHARDWPRSLRAYAFPRIGGLPVSEVTTADVLAILTPIWHDKPETARRVRQRIGAVMKWAVAMGHRQDNPAGDALGQAIGRQQAVVQHMRALSHGSVADALATVRVSQASVTTKRAFEFLVLTAARSGEVRLATRDEMDLDAGVWTIPAARMKAKRDHRVPLSGRALAILHDVQSLSDGTGLVFLRRPRFSWTRIKGESDVQGGRGNGSVEAGEGIWVGSDGGSPEGDRSPSRRRGGWVGGLGARAAVEREPEAGGGAAAAARRVTRRGLARSRGGALSPGNVEGAGAGRS